MLVSLENQGMREVVSAGVSRLRGIAHAIDLHQLAKDLDALVSGLSKTPKSIERIHDQALLGRYLDYCSELLSLTGKGGYLYIQDYHDGQASEYVNNLEDLTSGLSRTIWQKIVVLGATGPCDGGATTGGSCWQASCLWQTSHSVHF